MVTKAQRIVISKAYLLEYKVKIFRVSNNKRSTLKNFPTNHRIMSNGITWIIKR